MERKTNFILLLLLVFTINFCYAQAPNISYTSPRTYVVEKTITVLIPTNTGGTATGYSIDKPLPLGLGIVLSNGHIYGTPVFAMPPTTYTITATNSSGSSTATLVIQVIPPHKPLISYDGSHVYNQYSNVSFAPTSSGGDIQAQRTVDFAPGLGAGSDLTSDAAGNVYAISTSSHTLEKIPAGGGTPVIITTALSSPSAIAVDAAGNVYVVDGQVIKKFPAGGASPVTIGTGGANPTGVAVDSSGNIYITDPVSRIIKISPDGTTINNLANIFVNLSRPSAIAIDNADDIYLLDNGSDGSADLLKIRPGNDTAFSLTTIKSLHQLSRIAIGHDHNIYAVDFSGVYEIPAAGGEPIFIKSFYNPIGNSSRVTGIGVDVINNIYVSNDLANITVTTPTGYFLNTPLPRGLNFNAQTGAISGRVNVPPPAKNYSVTAYNTGGSYTTTFNLTINPLPAPQVSYPEPNVLPLNKPATITPTGNASGSTFSNSYFTGTLFAKNLPQLKGMAIDAKGYTYITQGGLNLVKRISPAGDSVTMFATHFSSPTGIAVDNSGNILVADDHDNNITKFSADGHTRETFASGLANPQQLATDNANNVYVLNQGNHTIQKFPHGGGAPVTIGADIGNPSAITVDGAGNVFVTDLIQANLYRIPAGGNTATNLISDSTFAMYGMVADKAGNLIVNVDFIYDAYNTDRMVTISAGKDTFDDYPVSDPNPDDEYYYENTFTGTILAAGNNVIENDGDFGIVRHSPESVFAISPALPTGLKLDKMHGVISGTPTTISPATNYTVTSYNSTGLTATTTVNIAVVNEASLSNLALSKGKLNPAFTPAVINYHTAVPNAVSSIMLTPTALEAGAVIKVNGVNVTSGTASAAIPLSVGTDTITTVVTTSDGLVSQTYTLTVTRAAANLSTNVILTSIVLSPKTTLTSTGTVNGVTGYTTPVPNSETSLTVTSIHQDASSTITVNGQPVTSGAASQSIPLVVGNNTITIVCTAQDSATTRTYIITAARAASPVATLANLILSNGTLSPVFAPATTGYTAIVPNAITSIKLTPTVTDANATVKVNDVAVISGTASAAIPLTAGSNAITTLVTAQDGTTTQTYTVTVNRAAAGLSTNAVLSSIVLNPKTTLTSTGIVNGITGYTTPVPNSESSVTVTASHADANSTITVNGQAVTSGVASQSIPLAVGNNTITVVCTAQDGATTRIYVITATRAAGIPVVTLANLVLSTGALNPAFAAATVSYTAIVPYATTYIKLTPTVTDASATVKVNGTTVASGIASAAIPLATGSNTIATVVTAQDGATTKTYTLTVTRAAAGLSTNAVLSSIVLNPGTTLTSTGTANGVTGFTTSVPNSEASVTVTATRADANSTIKENGQAVTSGTPSQAIPLVVGDNTITIVCTAQDGVTTRTYVITATRAASGLAMKYDEPGAVPILPAGVLVHQSLSPNNDGNSDILTIDGIAQYPENTLQIMDRSGKLVYQVKGYDNHTRVFDGQSNINGKLQPSGTYFYSLDYRDGNETKHKTGFIVLKY